MPDFTENDLRTIERERDLPPDQDDEATLDSDPYDHNEEEPCPPVT